jgi:hypothetical protein
MKYVIEFEVNPDKRGIARELFRGFVNTLWIEDRARLIECDADSRIVLDGFNFGENGE